MLLKDIILEIQQIEKNSIHKAAFDIHQLLKSNKKLLLLKVEIADYSYLSRIFEDLTYANPKEYSSLSYEREFETAYNLLLFYLNKII